MGILVKHLHLIAMQRSAYPILGDVLVLGQQRVYATENEVRNIFAQHSIALNDLPPGYDWKSNIPDDDPMRINVKALFKMLGADNVFTLDVSDYEGADIILDLNEPIRNELENRFDVLFDSGTLEHIFDVPTALTNIVKMLKPNGLVVMGCVSSNAIDHGFYSFSPTLFFDFFASQNFTKLSCYMSEASVYNPYLRSRVYKYLEVGVQFPIFSRHPMETQFWAIKNGNGCLMSKPMQTLYKKEWKRNNNKKSNSILSTMYKIVMTLIGCIPASVRPELIDAVIVSAIQRYGKRDNFRYIGKF